MYEMIMEISSSRKIPLDIIHNHLIKHFLNNLIMDLHVLVVRRSFLHCNQKYYISKCVTHN